MIGAGGKRRIMQPTGSNRVATKKADHILSHVTRCLYWCAMQESNLRPLAPEAIKYLFYYFPSISIVHYFQGIYKKNFSIDIFQKRSILALRVIKSVIKKIPLTRTGS